MTVDDGSTLDSRQPLTGDPASQITHTSLATSLLWWSAASSLVNLILDCADDDPFALVIGNRSVVDLRQDGRLHRTRLRSLLSGGTTAVELIRTSIDEPLPAGYEEATILRNWSGHNMGTVGFKRGTPGKRWRFLNGNEYYLTQAGAHLRATVIVDASGTVTSGDQVVAARFEALEQRRLFDNDTVLVVPHTHRTEAIFRGYADWVRAGRPADGGYQPTAISAWDPTAPPDPIRYTWPVPVQAEFGVTGLVQDGEWRDPSDLEAARTLLQARYDLKIGIWDLVGNATLRRTLLNAVPPGPTPVADATIPGAAAKRAASRVATNMAEREAEDQALRTIATHLECLGALGWVRGPGDRWSLQFPMTEAVTRWPGSEPAALVQLALTVTKRHSEVDVSTTMYNQVDLGPYVLAHRRVLEQIAAPDPCALDKRFSPTLWWAQGGWADNVDWDERARALSDRTLPWVKAFENLCKECHRIHEEMFGSR